MRRSLFRFVFAALLLALLGGLAAPGRAQTPDRVYRLGLLTVSPVSDRLTRAVVLPELARLGFVEGRNLRFESRVGDAETLPALMRDMLAARPDAILAVGPAIRMLGEATRTVPIIGFGPDPVDMKFAASYARPGGNVTGQVILVGDLDVKRLQLLHDAVPSRRRIGVLLATSQPISSESELRAAAALRGLDLIVQAITHPTDYTAAFAAMRAAGAGALLIGAASELDRDAKILAGLALAAGLPTACEWIEMARAGCLLGYGPNRTAIRLRMADQIARILRGTPPGEIAIELPTLFEFGINLVTARALGIEVSPTLIARADEVIE